MRRLLFVAATVLIGLGPGLPATAQPDAQPGAPAGASLFFDDFDGPTLDRSHWNVEVGPGTAANNEQQSYVDTGETLRIVHGVDADGVASALEIKPQFRQASRNRVPRRGDFLSARLNTKRKAEFTYGTLAARIKLSAGKGLWPAFWAMGAKGAWPANGEIDIMENGGDPAWTTFAMHGPGYSGNTPITSQANFPAENDATQWHVYSVDLTKDAAVFRIDGVEKYRVSRADITKHGPWAYDNSKYLLLNLAVGGVYTASMSGMQDAPYPGVAAETVDLIKAGKVRLLVDWVKVTAEP